MEPVAKCHRFEVCFESNYATPPPQNAIETVMNEYNTPIPRSGREIEPGLFTQRENPHLERLAIGWRSIVEFVFEYPARLLLQISMGTQTKLFRGSSDGLIIQTQEVAKFALTDSSSVFHGLRKECVWSLGMCGKITYPS